MAKWITLAIAFALGGCASLSDIPISIGRPKPPAQQQARQTTPQQTAATAAKTSEEPIFPSWISIGKPPPLVNSTIQDHAVLQRGKPVPIWGKARAGEDVSVTLAGEQASATADGDGNWHLTLEPLEAGGPYQMTVTAGSVRVQTINDVMIGDVYLCSGQSNMEWPLVMAMHGAADAAAADNPMIRLLTVHRDASATPRTELAADDRWSVADPETVKDFSAVCYSFGHDLQPKAGVAIGLIDSVWGGSPIQPWMSRGALHTIGGFDQQLDLLSLYTTSPQAAESKWRGLTDAWWRAHDPAMTAQPAWSDPAYDDSAWSSAVPTGSWKDWGAPALKGFDGIIWFRKAVTLNKAQTYGPAELSLGPIDQADKTFVNGVEVGGSEGWNNQRTYSVPEGILHEGENVIAVAAFGGDGMSGPRSLAFANGTAIKLDTPWRYRVSAPVDQTGVIPHTPWLNELGLTMLYNGMIAPLGRTPLSGILWYQGESNTGEAAGYGRLLSGLVADWRGQFGADVPFFIVQLPGYGPPDTAPRPSSWAQLREAQRQVTLATPNTALAVTIDLGDRANLHPVDKQEVGRRLALLADRMIYHHDVVDSGPVAVSAVHTANTVAVRFTSLAQGFAIYEAANPLGFQICDGANGCRYANATTGRDEIDLDASTMPDVTSVRFCWADSPICNVYNSAGLPAVPFEMTVTEAAQPAPLEKKAVRKRGYRQ
jgi:sialate O-acetylesterase